MQDRKENQESVAAVSRAARWEQTARKLAFDKVGAFPVTGDPIQWTAGKAGYLAAVATDGLQYAAKVAGEVSHYVAELARENCGKRPGKSS
ncbi:MAG: hypothetical protein ACYCQI_08380 [Gammaproteobacteria bacterium]